MAENAIDAGATSERPRPKVSVIPMTFRHPAANDVSEDGHPGDNWSGDINGRAHKGDAQFMVLLLVLFIGVNALLAFLLYSRDKAAPPAQQPAISAPASSAAAPASTHTMTAPAHPVAISVSPIAPVGVMPAPATQLSPAPAAVTAAQPVSTTPVPPVVKLSPPKAYVTPVTPDTTKETSAPVQHVTVSDHHALSPSAGSATPLAAAPPAAQVQSALPTSAAIPAPVPVVSPVVPAPPAAPSPAFSNEGNATKDLLSVISKD